MNNITKVLFTILIGLVIYTLWPLESGRSPVTIHVWDAHINTQGHLNVLDVVLGETTLKQAEAILLTQSERALFLELNEGEPQSESIEAFFPTSPDRVQMIIELNAPDELLQRIKSRALRTIVFPSGSAKMTIAPEDMIDVEALTARSITYIPNTALDIALVTQHFGQAKQQIRDNDNNLHLLYPALGLDVVLPPKGKPLLQFVPPDQFDRLLLRLPMTTSDQ